MEAGKVTLLGLLVWSLFLELQESWSAQLNVFYRQNVKVCKDWKNSSLKEKASGIPRVGRFFAFLCKDRTASPHSALVCVQRRGCAQLLMEVC